MRELEITLEIDDQTEEIVTDRVVAMLRELCAYSIKDTIGFRTDFKDEGWYVAKDGQMGSLKTKWGNVTWQIKSEM